MTMMMICGAKRRELYKCACVYMMMMMMEGYVGLENVMRWDLFGWKLMEVIECCYREFR